MRWLHRILGDPPASAPASKAARRPPAPPEIAPDPATLRAALAVATAPSAREALELQLGQALGGTGRQPLASDAPAVWRAAISAATDKGQALAWLEQVADEGDLGTIARSARFAEVRVAAAQRIEDSAALEALARDSKASDKGVYRHCAEVLRRRRHAAAQRARALALAAALRSRLEQTPVSVSHILELERAWSALEADAAATNLASDATGAPALEDGRALLAQANARLLREGEDQRSLQALHAKAESLAAELASAGGALAAEAQVPDSAAITRWGQALDALAQAQLALPSWLAGQATGRALDQRREQIAGMLAELARTAECWERAQRQLADSADVTAPGDGLDELLAGLPPPLQAIVQERRRKPAAPVMAGDAALPAAAAAPSAAPGKPSAPLAPRFDRDEVRAQIDALELAIGDGQLASAEAAMRQIRTALGEATLGAGLDARLQRAQSQLASLRDWAKWGATKKREDLIAAAQELHATVAAGTADIAHLAVAIPALREEWKRLNAQGPAGKGQWETFDGALEAAYAPVAAVRAEEAARRAHARSVREALLADWEADVGALGEGSTDAGAIEQLRARMIVQWRAAPHAGYRDERALRARFDALVNALDERLQSLRAAEIARREQLIADVAALADVADVHQATEQAKQLQERWRGTAGAMRLRRGDEQKLWQRFRAACDAVFARRDAEREAVRARRALRHQERRALLDGFAAAVEQADAQALRRALQQFRSDWDGGAGDGGAAEPGGVDERRARELQRQAQQRIEQLQIDALRERYARMAAAAAPADGVAPEVLEAGLAQRQDLLIDMEIALGLVSPGASAQLRRRRQLEQLQSRFRSGPAPAPVEQDPDRLLQRWYAIAAPPDTGQDLRIAAVLQCLLQREAARLGAAARGSRERPEPPSRNVRRPAGSRGGAAAH